MSVSSGIIAQCAGFTIKRILKNIVLRNLYIICMDGCCMFILSFTTIWCFFLWICQWRYSAGRHNYTESLQLHIQTVLNLAHHVTSYILLHYHCILKCQLSHENVKIFVPTVINGPRWAGGSVSGPGWEGLRHRCLLPSPGCQSGCGRTGGGKLHRVPISWMAVSGEWWQVCEDPLCRKRYELKLVSTIFYSTKSAEGKWRRACSTPDETQRERSVTQANKSKDGQAESKIQITGKQGQNR